MTERHWKNDFERTAAQIPAAWIVRDADGFVGIDPQYGNEPLVKLYLGLTQLGYARGWL